MASLQEQLLKAGLIDAKKAKAADKEKRKENKVARKSREGLVDDNKILAEQALADKARRNRELNLQHQEQANQKAIAAQIRQMILVNNINKGKPDVGFNFVDDSKIKKIYISKEIQHQLGIGNLAIVKLADAKAIRYEIVPAKCAQKIAQRDSHSVLMLNEKTATAVAEDDPYAAYQIPDDLMW
jgi:uncharacterized protein